MSIVTTSSNYWSLHSHSRFSVNDALPSVEVMVAKAKELGYPALGLTDHGSVSGSVRLYTACRKAGIEPLPGIELYVVPDSEYAGRSDNMHLTLNAYSEIGYRNLMHLATLTQRRFWYKPRIDFADFAQMAQDGETAGLCVATGCYFGVLPQVLMKHGPEAARKVAETLAGWFPRVYVELQNHGIDEHKSGPKGFDITDDELVAALYDVANKAGLPMVVTRDSHYAEKKDRHLHEALKRMVSFSDDAEGLEEAVFPGGGYFMTDEAGLREYFEPKYLAAGMEGLHDLVQAAYLRLPELEHFTLKIPDVLPGRDPQLFLEEKVMGIYKDRTSDHKDPRYLASLRMEFDVLRTGGMAPYIVLVDKVCQFMRDNDISFHARGSAAGSYVNFLLGITQVDPIRFGLRFDRFLSSNRLKPPDVDLDVEDDRRAEVVAFLAANWYIRTIGSLMKYSLFDSDNDEGGDNGKGSLRVRYYSTLKKKGITDPPVWGAIPERDKQELYALAKMKLVSGYGTHAAGQIIAPDKVALSQLPLAWIPSSKKLVTAYDKKDVEKLGFLKLDLLGLRTRTAIKIAQELSGVNFETIPEDDKETFKMISDGRTTGVFQLDGFAARKGCERLKPTKIEDVIAAMALFRPAATMSGATGDFLARRKKTSKIPVRHQDIMDATKETYGVLLYQEQVMDIMQSLGMVGLELETMLDSVKASNEASIGALVAIEAMMPRIREMALARDWTSVDLSWLTEGLVAYAEYSFNKAHAASYGVIAYREAYMRCHYAVEFWTGMLVAYAHAPKPKGKPAHVVVYTLEARKDGVTVIPPHVNKSGVTYSMETVLALGKSRNAIRTGLISIKGVGDVASKELASKAPYTSLSDMGERLLPKKVSGAKGLALHKSPADCGGIISILDEIEALEGLEM